MNGGQGSDMHTQFFFFFLLVFEEMRTKLRIVFCVKISKREFFFIWLMDWWLWMDEGQGSDMQARYFLCPFTRKLGTKIECRVLRENRKEGENYWLIDGCEWMKGKTPTCRQDFFPLRTHFFEEMRKNIESSVLGEDRKEGENDWLIDWWLWMDEAQDSDMQTFFFLGGWGSGEQIRTVFCINENIRENWLVD